MESIWINGNTYHLQRYSKNKEGINSLSTFARSVIAFILDWKDGQENFEFHTSGTTGKLKIITLSRDQMIASAEMTMKFLDFKGGGNILLCLEPKYIAGAMMLVRALLWKCYVYAVTPSGNPLMKIPESLQLSLASLVPMQLDKILSKPELSSKIKNIKNILIGGAPLSIRLQNLVQSLSPNMFLTFGMTETASHFAIRKLNGADKSNYFQALNSTEISTDKRGCLTITGIITNGETIITNDLVEIIDRNKFKWLGRIDHVINSGGIKLNLDLLEKKIRKIFNSDDIENDFFLEGITDRKLGEKLIMIFETGNLDAQSSNRINSLLDLLPKYEIPKEIRFIKKFFITKTGKINRLKSLESAK